MGKPVRDVAHVRRDDDGVEDRRRRLHDSAAASPTAAKSGRYTGTYSDGGNFNLDVNPSGPSVLNVLFDNNGHCADGGTIGGGQGFAPGPYQVQPDVRINCTPAGTWSAKLSS